MTLHVLGANQGLGQRLRGVESAPSWIRKQGLLSCLDLKGMDMNDLGDIQGPSSNEYDQISFDERVTELSEFCFTLKERNLLSLKGGARVLNIGGDHSIAIGSVAASLEFAKDLHVFWIDAHADINTLSSSLTKNIHGMPVSILLGLDSTSHHPHFQWIVQNLRPEQITYLGLRDLDPFEKELLQSLKICHYSTSEIRKSGVRNILRKRLNEISSPYFHVSFDVDVLDPKWAPSTGVRVEQGLHLSEVQAMMKEIKIRGAVIGFDLVELNPLLGSEQGIAKTKASIQKVLKVAI